MYNYNVYNSDIKISQCSDNGLRLDGPPLCCVKSGYYHMLRSIVKVHLCIDPLQGYIILITHYIMNH